jgi:hypothetical protein
MAFPFTALDVRTELDLSGWTDITTSVYYRAGHTITRGRRSEGSRPDVSTTTMTINNRAGNFSPRNPTGAYYGKIGRNTRCRTSLPWSQDSFLRILSSTTGGQYAYCADAAALRITGDLDIRFEIDTSWQPDGGIDIVGRYTRTGSDRSYAVAIYNGWPELWWSTDGADSTGVTPTVKPPMPLIGRRAIRVTLDVNNGSGGYTVTWYTSDSISGTWTQLGDAIATTGGTTSINAGTSRMEIGDLEYGNGTFNIAQVATRIYAVQVYDGIGGTLVADADFTGLADGATSFTDSTSNDWTVVGGTVIGRDYRHHGEISEFPMARDTSGQDRYVSVVSSGVLRRLGAGAKAFKSAYYRACTSTVAPITNLVAYWPMTDSAGSTTLAPATAGTSPMSFTGSPTLASDSSFACSSPLLVASSDFSAATYVPAAADGAFQIMVLLKVPSGGVSAKTRIMSVETVNGDVARYNLYVDAIENLYLDMLNASGTVIGSSFASFASDINGKTIRVYLSSSQNGSDVDATYSTLAVGEFVGQTAYATATSVTLGHVRQINLATDQGLDGSVIGQLTLQSSVSSIFDFYKPLKAYAGETVSDRFTRLCGEEKIDCVYLGEYYGEPTMGTQGQKTFLDLLQEVETADGGMLYEPRDFLGLAYRSSASMESQDAALTLDYDGPDLSPPFQPSEDDRYITNDVTVSRDGGSSARYEVTSGPLNTSDPTDDPQGVGLYDTAPSISAYDDSGLPDQASWRAHLGTNDDVRFASPPLKVDLTRAPFVADPSKAADVVAADIGDRAVVQNPPVDLPPDDMQQLLIGITELLNAFEHTLEFVTRSAEPFRVGIYDAAAGTEQESRYDTDGCTVNGGHTAPVTSLAVTNVAGTEWSHADGDFEITVAGARFTVTAVSGTGTSQTLTVSLSNGVSKDLADGDTVSLAVPCYYGK